jgi:hypothetical protein
MDLDTAGRILHNYRLHFREYTGSVHNWSSACANNANQVHDTTGYHARVQRRGPGVALKQDAGLVRLVMPHVPG